MKTKLLSTIIIFTAVFFSLNAQTANSKTTSTRTSTQTKNNVSQTAALVKNVTVKTPGTFATLLTTTDKLKVNHLKINGSIDVRDIEVMNKKMPALKTLDLSATSIAGYEQSPENRLPDYSFVSKESLTKIILPANLTSIGKSALAYTKNLNEIILPETLTFIDEGAFSFSGLNSVNIPDALSTSVLSKFSWCQNLTKITVSADSKNFIIDNDILYSKNMDTLYMCPRTKRIAFTELGIDKMQNLKAIYHHAFNNCKGLTGTVAFPAQLEFIGDYAFSQCDGLTGTLTLPVNLKKTGKEAFNGCRGFTGELKIPVGITEIEKGAFALCSGFTGVLQIPKGVSKIGFQSFVWCTGLSGLILPDGLTEIDNLAFSECTGLTGKLDIPGSVKRIGKEAFKFCRKLTRINITAKKSVNDPNLNGCYIDTDAFMGCEYSVYVGNRQNY